MQSQDIDNISHITFKIGNSALKQQAHYFFDLIWKTGLMKRGDAYKWLSCYLCKPEPECHFSRMDKTDCINSIIGCINYLNENRLKCKHEQLPYFCLQD